MRLRKEDFLIMKGVVMDPAKDGKRFMRGNEEERGLREIAWLIDKELMGFDQFVGGLSTFPRGMTARLRAHPDVEEINVVLEGEGDFITPERVSP